MTESIFDDIETTAQTPKPHPKVQHMQKRCTCCIECRFFAGRARDRLASLFKQGKGYCDHPEHAWGIWNVVQDIEHPTKPPCQLFSPATETTVQARLEAVRKLRNRDV